MLGTIREKTQGIFAFIIVGLLIIPFALWGINSYFEGDPNPPVAEVDGVEIKTDEFESTYQAQVNRLRGRVDPKFLSSGMLRQQVLNSMVNEVLYNQHAHDAGYIISNTQLNNLIQNQPEFKNGDKFDPERFNAILRANGLDELTYKREMRSVKIQDQMLSGYKFSAIVPQSEVDTLLALRNERRKISYLALKPSYLRSQVKVSAQDIQDYYNANKLRFQTPDQVRIEYVILAMNDLIDRQKVSEKSLKAEYERHIAQYRTPAERRASHILIELPSDADEAEEKAAYQKIEEIQKLLKQGMSFAAVAKKHSQDLLTGKKGGDLGSIQPGTLPSKDLEAALVKLKQGQVSEPVRSQYGIHLLKLTSLVPAKTRPFSSVRKELERSLKVRLGEAAFDDLRERFETLVYEHPDSLKPAAEDTGLKIQTSDWLSRSGGKGVLASPDVIRAAFSLQVRQMKQNSDIVEAGRNVLVAVRLKEDRPAEDKPLAQVRSQIKALLLEQKAKQAARDVGEELLQKARTGKSLASLASGKAGATLMGPLWIKRADVDARDKIKMDIGLARAAFAAGKPAGKAVYGGLQLRDGGYAIYQVHQVNPGDAKQASAKERAELIKLLTERRGSGYYQDQLSSLRQQAKVEIHSAPAKSEQ